MIKYSKTWWLKTVNIISHDPVDQLGSCSGLGQLGKPLLSTGSLAGTGGFRLYYRLKVCAPSEFIC